MFCAGAAAALCSRSVLVLSFFLVDGGSSLEVVGRVWATKQQNSSGCIIAAQQHVVAQQVASLLRDRAKAQQQLQSTHE